MEINQLTIFTTASLINWRALSSGVCIDRCTISVKMYLQYNTDPFSKRKKEYHKDPMQTSLPFCQCQPRKHHTGERNKKNKYLDEQLMRKREKIHQSVTYTFFYRVSVSNIFKLIFNFNSAQGNHVFLLYFKQSFFETHLKEVR